MSVLYKTTKRVAAHLISPGDVELIPISLMAGVVFERLGNRWYCFNTKSAVYTKDPIEDFAIPTFGTYCYLPGDDAYAWIPSIWLPKFSEPVTGPCSN